MRIVVVGAGGVGGVLGLLLARSGAEVAFVARGATLAAIRASGLSLESPLGAFTYKPQAAEDPAELGKADTVLVAVKSWQVAEVAPKIEPLLGEDTVVVPFQNGVEAAGHLAAALGEKPVLGGLCWIFAWQDEPGKLKHVGFTPRCTVGERKGAVTPRARRVCDALVGAGIEATVSDDMEAAIWEKFLFIDPFGTLGAVTRVPVGVFRSVPESRELLQKAIAEVEALARARGVKLRADAAARTLEKIDGVLAEGTASMQRDIMAGRQSELLEQTGAVVRLARESGVDVPVHRALLGSLLPQELAARSKAERR